MTIKQTCKPHAFTLIELLVVRYDGLEIMTSPLSIDYIGLKGETLEKAH